MKFLLFPVMLFSLAATMGMHCAYAEDAGEDDAFESPFESGEMMGMQAAVYDACVEKGYIHNSGDTALNRAMSYIDKSEVALNKFPAGTTSEDVRNALRRGVKKGQEGFESRKAELTQQDCERVQEKMK